MNFPEYRKYLNDRSYFKIFSPSHFEELTITGNYYSLTTMHVKTLPERNFLNDMLYDYSNHWEVINDEMYNSKKDDCIVNKIRMDF